MIFYLFYLEKKNKKILWITKINEKFCIERFQDFTFIEKATFCLRPWRTVNKTLLYAVLIPDEIFASEKGREEKSMKSFASKNYYENVRRVVREKVNVTLNLDIYRLIIKTS